MGLEADAPIGVRVVALLLWHMVDGDVVGGDGDRWSFCNMK